MKLITSPAAFTFRRAPSKTGAASAVERKSRREVSTFVISQRRTDDIFVGGCLSLLILCLSVFVVNRFQPSDYHKEVDKLQFVEHQHLMKRSDRNYDYDKLKFVGQSIRLPINRLRLVTDTRSAQLFIHDQKSAQAMKVVHVSFTSEVIGEITDIRAFANVDQIRHPISAH